MISEPREQAYLIGPRAALVGVVTEGAERPSGAPRPTIVILNAGIIHRVGPSRLHVLLARELAAAGYTTLRFDLSGIGDSAARSDGLPPLDAALADIREVLDWLEATRGGRRVILAGLCSGAMHALCYAGSDKRVVGVVLLDPFTPKTRRYYVRHYGSRLLRARSWYNLAHGDNLLVRRMKARLRRENAVEDLRAQLQPKLQSPEVRAYLERAYRSALDRDVQFLVAYTAGMESFHNYREQLLDAFPGLHFGDRLRLEYLDGVDHTFTLRADRSRLFRLIVSWVEGATFASRDQ